MSDVYIVEGVRTPGCRRGKGALAQTRPEALLTHVLKSVVERAGLDKAAVEDVLCGCAFPEAEQGLNVGRIAALMAGFPLETTGVTINRFCASGLEAIALQAARIKAGWADVCIGAGLESMSIVPMGGNLPRPSPDWAKINPDVYISMGITAENVANRYNVSRADQDFFAMHSNLKAAEAQKNKAFGEIVPTPANRYKEKDGKWVREEFLQDFDDGVRAETTVEGLTKLKPAFAAGGSVTAGNSSQTTDGSAAVLLMSEAALKKYGKKPIAKFVSYVVAGCNPDEMGIGPMLAIPKLLKLVGWDIKKLQTESLIIEMNEAFASQAIYCARELGISDQKYWSADSKERRLNINGGAIALGHPLGCTGAKLMSQLVFAMKAKGVKYGIESMCIGGGMGAAALVELCD